MKSGGDYNITGVAAHRQFLERRAHLLARLERGPIYVTSTNPKGRPVFKRDLSDLSVLVKEGLVLRKRTNGSRTHKTAKRTTYYVLANPTPEPEQARPEPYKKRTAGLEELTAANPRLKRK